MSENNESFSEVLMYKGKLLKKSGTRQDKEGKDVNWKLWNLMFDAGENKQYDWKCSCFDPLSDKSIQLADLKEGEYYEVVYNEEAYEHPKYGSQKSKKAYILKESNKDSCTAGLIGKNNNSKDATPSTQTTFKADGWVQFSQGYNRAMGDKGNAMHMLGAYVANKCVTEFNDIIELCKQNFKK